MWRLAGSGIKPMEKISRTIIGPESGSVFHVTSAQASVILKPRTESFQSHSLSDRGESAVCNAACILFGFRSISDSEVAGRRVMEIGSADRNGSLRPIIESYHPREYVGIDVEPGPGVDRVAEAGQIARVFGEESFDLVVSTETLEHIRDWRGAASNTKRAGKRGGVVVLTTRSIGFPYHAYPHDFWRYEPEDVRAIFSDMDIVRMERDSELTPGVFAKIRKPVDFLENGLSNHELYSIAEGKRVRQLDGARARKFVLLKGIAWKVDRLTSKLL